MAAAEPPQNQLNLDSMSLDQLTQLKQTEENRLDAITSRYSQLRAASARFTAAKTALSSLTKSTSDKEKKPLMIPLTASLYAPGYIQDPNKMLVELGTGFYVEKSSKEAHAFLDRKMKIVDGNSENIVKVIQMTRQNVESINGAIRGKMLEIRARSEGGRYQREIEEALKK